MSLRNDEKSRYLVLMRLGGEINRKRIAEAAPAIKDTIDRLSDCQNKLFFSSGDSGSFGFFVLTDFRPSAIKATLYGETDIVQTACLDSYNDSVFISEVSSNWTAAGFSNGWSWLQHN